MPPTQYEYILQRYFSNEIKLALQLGFFSCTLWPLVGSPTLIGQHKEMVLNIYIIILQQIPTMTTHLYTDLGKSKFALLIPMTGHA